MSEQRIEIGYLTPVMFFDNSSADLNEVQAIKCVLDTLDSTTVESEFDKLYAMKDEELREYFYYNFDYIAYDNTIYKIWIFDSSNDETWCNTSFTLSNKNKIPFVLNYHTSCTCRKEAIVDALANSYLI